MNTKPLQCGNNASYCKFGIYRLTQLVEALENQIGGVIESEDIEYVHKMRVASRRIRATLPLFKECLPKKKFKKWRREIKKVTKLLGEARDLDVQVAFIKQFQAKNNASAHDSLAALLLENKNARRAQIQPSIEQGLKRLQNCGALGDMKEFFGGAAEVFPSLSFVRPSVIEKAYEDISSKLDDFLAMEQFVYQEDQNLKHHQMRMRGKHLRYTLETFSELYPDKLADEFDTMKNFQDVLGEMHDCDVWLAFIPQFMKTTRGPAAKTENALGKAQPSAFLQYVKEQRKNHYQSFVSLWESTNDTGFFDKLRDTISAGLPRIKDQINALQQTPQAKVAVLSDIHGNQHALQAVLEDAENRGVKFFLNAGDSTGYGPFPNEVVELLHAKNIISVKGNFDLEVLQNAAKGKRESKIALDFARKQTSGTCKAYLSSLPEEIRLEINGKTVLLTHGSPESIDEHLYPNTPERRLKEIAKTAKADIIITGHSHVQLLRESGGAVFLNPGSVGRPNDGNPQAAYAVVQFNPFSAELLRVDYDVFAAAKALRKKGLPESFSQMLLRGVAIDQITKEDRQRKATTTKKCRETTKNCAKISKQSLADTKHHTQVRKLALILFDELKNLHKLSEVERCWLECASILHDIGIIKGTKAHNKKSMELVLNDTRLLLPSMDRRVIASIARYHRKSLPAKKHYNLNSLSPKTIKKIELLSGIIRIADSLDYVHNGIVKKIQLKIAPQRIVVECSTSANPAMEQQAFNKKKDLLENVLKRKLVLEWNES